MFFRHPVGSLFEDKKTVKMSLHAFSHILCNSATRWHCPTNSGQPRMQGSNIQHRGFSAWHALSTKSVRGVLRHNDLLGRGGVLILAYDAVWFDS